MTGADRRVRFEHARLRWSQRAPNALWRRRHDGGASLYCSGRSLPVPVADAIALADAGVLDGAAWDALDDAGREAAYALYQAGHYALATDDPDAGDEDGDEA